MERSYRPGSGGYAVHRASRRPRDRDVDIAFAQQPRSCSVEDARRGRDNIAQPAASALLRLARSHQVHPGRLSSAPAIRTPRCRYLFKGSHTDPLGEQGTNIIVKKSIS